MKMGKNDDEVRLLPINGSTKKNYVSFFVSKCDFFENIVNCCAAIKFEI